MKDRIILNGIQVMAYVGVPESERANPQLLEVTIILELDLRPAAHAERLSLSVDYAEVHRKTIEVIQHRHRPLIETVAEDVAQMLLNSFAIERAEVEVQKFILPNTRSVAVRIVREAE